MNISQKALSLIKKWEGCYLTAYQDVVGVWTIGYGTTNSDRSITGTEIKSGLVISQETADEWLRKSVENKYVPLVEKYNSKYNFNQNQFDALVSFCYNVGSIDQLTANGTRSKEEIASHISLYNKAGGKVYRGLTNRRADELNLYNTPCESRAQSSEETTMKEIQNTLNERYSTNLSVDGIYGPKTKKALIKALQIELNKQSAAKLSVDGVFGSKTQNACITVKEGAKGNITWILQAMLYAKGYKIQVDGVFGSDTLSKVKQFQSAVHITQDGVVGKITWSKLFE